jgi:hypothetical protein
MKVKPLFLSGLLMLPIRGPCPRCVWIVLRPCQTDDKCLDCAQFVRRLRGDNRMKARRTRSCVAMTGAGCNRHSRRRRMPRRRRAARD